MRTNLLAVLCGLASCAAALAFQPPMPKPGPEQDKLKAFVGDWDCVVKFGDMEMKGTATYTLGFGGFWLTETFKSDGPEKFEGRGTMGYDPNKKKYVSTWIDSESPSMMVSEGDYDKDGKTYTEIGDGPGEDGKPQKYKSAVEFKDKDTIVMTMAMVKDGKDQQVMTITYK
ncbi:MAG TPA: DUF1579 domain-containing protein, partial [Gemmataceae bacterium]|nr:DUF1579 domain-containing protein [Gemmataceae bacterium]